MMSVVNRYAVPLGGVQEDQTALQRARAGSGHCQSRASSRRKGNTHGKLAGKPHSKHAQRLFMPLTILS